MQPSPDIEDIKSKQRLLNTSRDGIFRQKWPHWLNQWKQNIQTQVADKLTRRLGWFTRLHCCFADDGERPVGLYSEGSVPFVSEIVDWGTYRALSTMSGGEVVAFQ